MPFEKKCTREGRDFGTKARSIVPKMSIARSLGTEANASMNSSRDLAQEHDVFGHPLRITNAVRHVND